MLDGKNQYKELKGGLMFELYTVVYAPDIIELQEKVQCLIRNWWKVSGGVAVTNVNGILTFYQAMTKAPELCQ